MSKVEKDDIIRAAEEVVREKGARKLSLDAVASRCGLSKGGLLHHFRNKQALLNGMLEAAIEREAELCAEFTPIEGASPAEALKNRIDGLFAQMADEEALPRSLVAAVAEDPSLLAPIKAKEIRVRTEVCERTNDPELAQILLYAARGMFLGRILGVVDAGDPVLAQLHRRLLEMCEQVD